PGGDGEQPAPEVRLVAHESGQARRHLDPDRRCEIFRLGHALAPEVPEHEVLIGAPEMTECLGITFPCAPDHLLHVPSIGHDSARLQPRAKITVMVHRCPRRGAHRMADERGCHMGDNGPSDDHPRVIGRVAQLARERRPDDDVLAEFVVEYYAELPEFDVDDRREDDLYAAALTHLALGRRRLPGTTIVQVVSPDWDRDGWHSDRTHVMVVTDDAPFLVDTVRLVLERHEVATHLLVHPMLCVRRGPDGVVTAIVGDERDQRSRDVIEAWTLVEIDRLEEAEVAG